jgi:hypothetical protein
MVMMMSTLLIVELFLKKRIRRVRLTGGDVHKFKQIDLHRRMMATTMRIISTW